MDEVADKLERGEPLSTQELLGYLPALKEVPATLMEKYTAGAAVRRTFRAGDIVCEEGEFGSTAFYIVSGHVEIFIANPLAAVRTKPKSGFGAFFKRMSSMLVPGGGDSAGSAADEGFIPIDASVDLPRTTPLAYLGAGELFGEMTCRTFQPRSATVRATEDCVMVEMLRVILDMLVGTRDPDAETKQKTKVRAPTFKGTSFKKQMDDQYRERSLVAHMRAVPLFATLDLEFFNYLKDRAQLVSCNKGEVICKQGDPADAFYLIRTGLVRVSQAMPGGEMVRTYLKKGEYFGEIGLLFDQARNATCSALDAVDLVKIDKETFRLMQEKFPIVRATLEQVAKARSEAAKDRRIPAGLQLDEFLNQGLFEAQNLLLIDLDHCTRCDACVNACSDAHDGVTRLIRDGLRYDRYLVATACRSCRDPLCMTQCPVGSIRRKESLEIIIEDWCIGCSKCAELCPYGNINMHSFDVMKEVAATSEKPAAKAPAPAATAGAKPAAPAKPATPAPAKPSAAAAPAPKPASAEASAPKAENASAPKRAAEPVLEGKPQPLNTLAPLTGERTSTASRVGEHAAVTVSSPEKVDTKVPVGVAVAAASSPAAEVAKAPEAAKTVKPAASAGDTAKAAAPAPSAKPATAPAKTAAPAAEAAKAEAKPKKMVRKKVTVSKATTCDLCTQLSVPSCVYACPHEAAMRVDPTKFLAEQIGRKRGDVKRRFTWFTKAGENRSTH
ncbi:cyclic nucleotide-binding domain-containing protein [Verrucomicrobiota bacterium sgz303538]